MCAKIDGDTFIWGRNYPDFGRSKVSPDEAVPKGVPRLFLKLTICIVLKFRESCPHFHHLERKIRVILVGGLGPVLTMYFTQGGEVGDSFVGSIGIHKT